MSIVQIIEEQVRKQFCEDSTGHDFYHIDRVRRLALYISRKEGGDQLVVELAALLHDISDHKFNGGDWKAGGERSYTLLVNAGMDSRKAKEIQYIVDHLSFKGALTPFEMNSLEGKIVQDADRLDAMGAIGIARAFAYGGWKGQSIHNPMLNPILHQSFSEYQAAESTTINHFHEKLLLLSDRLNTRTAIELGKERHAFMEAFLTHFHQDWNFNANELND